jgi:hypothetical protein
MQNAFLYHSSGNVCPDTVKKWSTLEGRAAARGREFDVIEWITSRRCYSSAVVSAVTTRASGDITEGGLVSQSLVAVRARHFSPWPMRAL